MSLRPADEPLLLDLEVFIVIGVGDLSYGGLTYPSLATSQRAAQSEAHRPAGMDRSVETPSDGMTEEAVEEPIRPRKPTVLLVAMR